MKRFATSAAGVAGAVIAAALVGTLVFSHQALAPRAHGDIATAASAAATDTPSPTDLATPSAAPLPAATPSQIATIQNPLPKSSPSTAPVQAPPPASPTPTVDPSASPTPPPPPPPPPPCTVSVDVSTLTAPNTWAPLGTWQGSAQATISPIFFMSGQGWLHYSYQFSATCIGHAKLVSTNAFNGALIYSDNATSTSALIREANLAPNTQVVFTLVLS